jgi:hypothetical protein
MDEGRRTALLSKCKESCRRCPHSPRCSRQSRRSRLSWSADRCRHCCRQRCRMGRPHTALASRQCPWNRHSRRPHSCQRRSTGRHSRRRRRKLCRCGRRTCRPSSSLNSSPDPLRRSALLACSNIPAWGTAKWSRRIRSNTRCPLCRSCWHHPRCSIDYRSSRFDRNGSRRRCRPPHLPDR